MLLVSDSGVGLGEVISLAYDLDEKVVIGAESGSAEGMSTTDFGDIFLLVPSAELRTALSSDYDLMPLLGTWQWYRAVPKRNGACTGWRSGLAHEVTLDHGTFSWLFSS